MPDVSMVFTEHERERAAAFVAMSVALDVFDPENDPHLEPFAYASNDEKIARAVRLASELTPVTASEATLVKSFKAAITSLKKNRAFTRTHRSLADKLRSLGLDTARHSYRMATSAK